MSEFPQETSPSSGGTDSIPNNSMAMISLIAGVLGLTAVPVLGSIIAILTGSMATREIYESDGSLGGEGMARVGTILGWVGIGLMVLAVCMAGLVIAASVCVLFIGAREAWGVLIPMVIGWM